MKTLNLKEFFGSTVLAVNPDSRTTVERRSNDGHIRRHLPVGLTKLLSLLFLLTLGVGQMWAYDIAAGTTVIWDAGSESWTTAQLYIYKSDYNTADDLTRIGRTTQFYKTYGSKWEGYSGLIFRKDKDWSAQTTDITRNVGSGNVLFTYDNSKNNGKLNWQITTNAKKATSGVKIYFDNTDAKWGEVWLKYGTQWYNRSSAARATQVTGTANLYVITIPNDCYFEKYYLASSYGWTGYNPINDTHVGNRIEYQASNLTSDITYVATGSTSGSSPTVYATTSFSGHTRRLTFGSHTNGQITVRYTDESGVERTVSSASAEYVDVAQTCQVIITAVPNSGYAPSTLTLGGASITSGAQQIIRANGEIAATFVAEETHNVTVSYKHGSRALRDNQVFEVGVTTPASINAEVIDGFSFSSWSNLTNVTNNTGNLTTNPISINTKVSGSDGSMTCNYTPWTCSLDIVPSEGATGHSSRMAMSYDATEKAYYINRTTTSATERYRFYINSIEYSTSGNTELTIDETKVNANTNVTNYASSKPSVYFNDGPSGSNITIWFDYENKKAWVTEQKHTVTISAGANGSVSPTSVSAGAIKASPSITATPNSHYHLSSWTIPSGVTLASGTTTTSPITIKATADDKMVTANFAGDQYTITYKDQNDVTYSGSNRASLPATHTYGTATALVDGSKAGYTFGGWYTDASCTSAAVSSIGATTKTANFTLYAKWTEKLTTVTLVASPAGKGTFTIGGAAATRTTAGVTTTRSVTAVPATGYRINTSATVWSTNNANITLSNNKANPVTVTGVGLGGTSTLTATFTPITYTVKFNGNGATSGSMSNQTGIAYDAATALTANAFVKTGYTFAGWATSAERANAGNVDRTDEAAHDNLSSTQGATVNLYAVWTPKQSALSFDYQSSAEGYSADGSISAVSATYDAAMPSLTGSLPTAANGYAFMGFYDAIGGTGTQYYDGTGASVTNWDKDTGSGTTLYAYYKKAEITALALSAGTVLPEGSVTATPTIEPTPTGTHKICWKLLYNNGTEYSPQPTFTPGVGNAVSFPAPTASGTYKVQAQLRTGSECGAGTLLSERTTSFVVAGTHTVTIQYKCGDQVIKTATTREGVMPLTWSELITAPNDIFGYTFDHWEAGDGVTISTDGTNAIVGTTTTTADIYIKAIYDGRLTAVYTKKNIIYFKNTLEWTNVYYHDSYWDSDKGGAGNKDQSHINQAMSLVPGTTNIYYWEGTPSGTDVAFTNDTYGNYQAFWSGEGAKVVYPSNPTCASSGDSNYGYNAGTPMFVPVEQDGQDFNDNGNGKAIYYNKGYWRAYDPTTGESGSTGYTLKIYDKTSSDGRNLLQSIPFANADASGQIFKASINLEAAKEYGIKVERDNSLMYTNIDGHLHRTGEVVAMSVNPDDYKAIYILTTAAGDYDFIITCNGSGELCLQATFPAAENDYRVLYTDNATWSNTAHVKETWVHPSRVISAEAGATDTISFFVSKDNSPEYKIQKVDEINETTGAITWTDVTTSWTSINVDSTGVYNFYLSQTSGAINVDSIKPYTGNYYIRTDNAGSTKWENYREEDHKMTYSEYAAKVSHADESMDFTHYFMKYVDKDIESGKYKNVKFTVANDYSPCISDTLVQQAGDTAITPNHVNDAGDLQASANIRFMWNSKNNKLQRAYLAAAQTDGSKFLVLQGESEKLLAPDGTALSDANGNNHRGGTDAIQFTDKEHWMYEAEVKAVPGGRVKLYATYHGGTFYYYGDNTASFTGTSAIDLVTGDDEEAQTIRVVYDFKTDRLIAAWVPSEETIENEKTVNADIMLIREHQGQGHQINLKGSGSIKTNKTVYGVLRFNRWTLNNKSTAAGHAVLPVDEQKSQYERFNYMISFPFDVKVGEIFGFGTIGRHYRIFYYDGLGRAQEGFFAERGDDNWRMIDDTDSILHANQGYLLQLNYIRMKDDNTETWPQANMNEVELYFPAMNEINTIKLENVEIPALGDAYKCKINLKPTYEAQGNPKADEADRRVKDSYWRCIGVPGFTSYEATADTWENFNWTTNAADMPYLYEWHMDDNKLSVVSSSTFTFKPMHAYLIQNGNSFTWRSVAVPSASSVVARRQAPASEDSYYEFYLEMSKDEEALDHTYVRLTNNERVTADFDFGQDLSKELNSGANIYTRMGYERLAANNLPMNNQTTIVPVGVTAAEEGEYTFAMPEGTNGTGVTLIDNETGTRTSLALTDYTVTLAKGTYDNRFVLEFSPVAQTPTGIEDAETVNRKSSNRKLLIDGILYIVKDGQVFDARGTKVK